MYEAPGSVAEAVQLLAQGHGSAKILAGGQSLVPMMKTRFAAPEMLVDINEIPDLGYHRVDPDGTIRVGALCRHADLERWTLLSERQPTMAATAPLVADPIVRTRGTLVGSVCHADPQGDWASVMTALDAQVIAQGPSGRRSIPVKDFVRGPFQNALAYDEIAVEAVVPPPGGEPAGGYLKLERRVGDYATVGVAVAIERSGPNVAKAGIALTAVGPATIAADAAAETLDEATTSASPSSLAIDITVFATNSRARVSSSSTAAAMVSASTTGSTHARANSSRTSSA